MNKYDYYKVIQEHWGSWEDVDFHEVNSAYLFKTRAAREAFKYNLTAYRENSTAPVRVIKRRELRETK